MTTLTRKAPTWHATAKVSPDAPFPGGISNLPVFRAAEVYADPIRALPTTDFNRETPQFFVLERAHGRRFLIDTSGNGYARYAAELVG